MRALKIISPRRAQEILRRNADWIDEVCIRYSVPNAAEEMTGRIDFASFSERELKLVFTRYNADVKYITSYGEQAYAYYLGFGGSK